MRCYEHPTLDVSGTCRDCGRGLCADCARAYNVPLCANCAHSLIVGEKSEITKSLVVSLVLAGVALLFTAGAPGGSRVLAMYAFAGIPWGWRALDRITPNVFLFMPLIGWAIYFGIKLTLAWWVGLVALPVVAFKRVARWRELRELEGRPAIGG